MMHRAENDVLLIGLGRWELGPRSLPRHCRETELRRSRPVRGHAQSGGTAPSALNSAAPCMTVDQRDLAIDLERRQHSRNAECRMDR